jgi:hypothetical protein
MSKASSWLGRHMLDPTCSYYFIAKRNYRVLGGWFLLIDLFFFSSYLWVAKVTSRLSWGWLRGRTTGQAVCRLASRGIPRPRRKKTGSSRKGRLCQQPADDSTEEGWSRAKETKPLNGCLAKSRMAPTRATEAQDRRDECHDHDWPMRRRRLLPMAGS